MLWIFIAVLFALWLAGVILKFTLKGLLHILLFAAVIILIARLFI
jgi:hypothetical protein